MSASRLKRRSLGPWAWNLEILVDLPDRIVVDFVSVDLHFRPRARVP